MSIRNILIIVLIIVLLILFFRNRGNFRTYELKGKVTMNNDCSDDINDLPSTIRIKGQLHFTNPSERPVDFDNLQIPAASINPSTKEAEYSFEVTTLHTAKEWKIELIRRSTNLRICDPIKCEGDPVCRNRTTLYYTIPVPSGQRVVTKDYTFNCSCYAP